jgi:hypothetical protein
MISGSDPSDSQHRCAQQENPSDADTGIQGEHLDGCYIRHIRCFRSRLDLAGISFPDPLSLLADLPPMGSSKISGNSSIDMELYFVFTPTLMFRFSGNRTAC